MRSRPGKVHLKSTPEQLRLHGLLLDEAPACGHLDLAEIFGNSRPVEVEVGPGKGTFLLRRAAQRPEINLLALEWLGSYAAYAADRALRAGLKNVRVLCADAAAVFTSALPDSSVQRVYIYFPDPWPKRKHHRRRLITVPFLTQVRRVLRLGGWLGIVTDHTGYFRQIRMAVGAVDGLTPVEFHQGPGEGLIGSNFERKYAAAGRTLLATAAIRRR